MWTKGQILSLSLTGLSFYTLAPKNILKWDIIIIDY
jgi:hypothetical protein